MKLICMLLSLSAFASSQEVIPLGTAASPSTSIKPPSTAASTTASTTSSTTPESSRSEVAIDEIQDVEVTDKPPCFPAGMNTASNILWSLKPENIRTTISLLLALTRRTKPCEPFLPNEIKDQEDGGDVKPNEDTSKELLDDMKLSDPTFIQRVSDVWNSLRSNVRFSPSVESR